MLTEEIERLSVLCKIWGVVKFYHPWLVYRDIDWDQALLDVLPAGRDIERDLASVIDQLLRSLNDPLTRLASEHEDEIEAPEPEGDLVVTAGDVVVVRARGAAGETWAGCSRMVRVALEQATAAAHAVLDLRGADWMFMRALRAHIGMLLERDAHLPGDRVRMHSGYNSGGTSGSYFSAWIVSDGEVISSKAARGTDLAMIVDGRETGGCQLAAALQRSAGARVIIVGDAHEPGHSQIVHADDVRVHLRTQEWLWPDGTMGFEPDALVAATDDAQAVAIGLLARPARTGGGTPIGHVAFPKPERDFPESYPDRDVRMLGLFRFWNIIDRFFPYHHLLDQSWDAALPEFIPRFDEARDAVEYALAAAELATRMQDTHAGIQSTVLRQHLGERQPDIDVRYIENLPVIVRAGPTAAQAGARVGDVIRSIDRTPAAERWDTLSRIAAASTPQAQRWRIAKRLLDSPSEELEIEVDGPDGAQAITVPCVMSTERTEAERNLPVFGVLGCGFGYFDLDRLFPQNVDEAFEAVRGTPALIIDIRNYPHGTAWYVAPRLAKSRVQTAAFTRPETRDPNREWDAAFIGKQFTEPSGWRYEGEVVCLIDERAISQSEHTCLFLSAATEVTFVGSATNGANGDVTGFAIPGGISASFTGHDVRHADGTQLQRVGIQPHVEVHPTIDAVRAQRDEVLDAAVSYLEERLSSRA